MAANRKKGSSLLAGLDNLVEKPVELSKIETISEEEAKELITLIPSEQKDEPPTVIKTPKEDKPVKEAVQKATKKFGRPRKFLEGEDTKVIGVKLRMNEVTFLEEYGGKYGGKTGYVTFLIRKEMERMGVDF